MSEELKKFVRSGNSKFCNRCIYNIYKEEGQINSPYPCGKIVCKPILEVEDMVDTGSNGKMFGSNSDKIFDRRRTVQPKKEGTVVPEDLGNGYIHTTRPANLNMKINETEVVKMDNRSDAIEKEVPGAKGKAVGVDVGTAFIVSALYDENQQISSTSIRDGFYKMEATKQKRNMLQSSNVSYITIGDQLFVVGNEAFDMAVLFEEKLRRPLRNGVLSADEKEAEPVLMEILRQVAGQGSVNDIVYYSVPANPVDSNFDIIYHEAMFKSFFGKLGFDKNKVYPLNETMAIVNSELADTMFTGLAISFGAGMTNVAMAYRGLEIFSFSVARGGDWIDHEVATNRQISLADATATKEDEDFDLLNPTDSIQDAIRIFYTAHLDYVCKHIAQNLEAHKRKIKLRDKLKIVLSGGTSKPNGFIKLFEQQLVKTPWSIPVGEIVHASNPLDAVARGCLIAAQRDLLDSEEGL